MKNNNMNSGFGISILIMIFTILCLTIFATLTYVQANYNYTQIENIVENKVEYFDADFKATEIYNKLKNALITDSVDEEWLNKNNIKFENDRYCYNVNINSKQILKVELENKEGNIEIITWQKVNNSSGDYGFESFVD